MACERVPDPSGGEPWIMCGDFTAPPAPPCSVCGAAGAEFLCDGPGAEPGKTCDAPLCGACTSQTAPLVTIPTDHAMRTVLRWAGGNIHAPIGAPIVGEERRRQLVWAHHLGLYASEPHDYCPRHRGERGTG